MYLLGLGLVLLGLKWAEIGPVAAWSWWIVMAPFGLAILWWAWADGTGYTRAKAMQREQARKDTRMDHTRERLGQRPKRPR